MALNYETEHNAAHCIGRKWEICARQLTFTNGGFNPWVLLDGKMAEAVREPLTAQHNTTVQYQQEGRRHGDRAAVADDDTGSCRFHGTGSVLRTKLGFLQSTLFEPMLRKVPEKGRTTVQSLHNNIKKLTLTQCNSLGGLGAKQKMATAEHVVYRDRGDPQAFVEPILDSKGINQIQPKTHSYNITLPTLCQI